MSHAPYAAREDLSRGRIHAEPPPAPYRGEFQRDRDRIIHSSAFRRLEYKTQVFVNHEGDLFRTRLTHSLEVAQITRSIARSLGLHEDLAEAIALAHDLGHTPFGHAGQDALNACMKNDGGFEHNLQSLRVVDRLEQRYPGFDGLNLCFETREGILKHCPPDKARLLGEVGERFLHNRQPGLEAQLANLADSIAYNSHDVDDGLRAGLLTLEQLRDQPFFAGHYQAVASQWPLAPPRRLLYETVRRMINAQVLDLTDTSRQRLALAQPTDIQAVRAQPAPLIAFSAEMAEQHRALKRFLHEHLYRHPQVYRMSVKAKHVVQRLFAAYCEDLCLLPPDTRRPIEQGQATPARGVADYIAGMTDRFALLEYRRLFDPNFFAAQDYR